MEDKASIQNRILQAVTSLFMKFGFRSISMDDIAHHLGMSKKTIYQFFVDKDEIVTRAMEIYIDTQKGELQRIKLNAKDPVDFLIRMNENLTRNIKEINAAVFYDLRKYHSHAWSLIEDFRNAFLYSLIVEDLKTGIQDGIFRSDIKPEVVAKLRLEEISMTLNEDVFPKTKFKPTDVTLGILDNFVYGIATERGKKLYNRYKTQIENRITESH